MKILEINGKKYEIVRNDKDCLKKDELEEKLTEYFDDFDYIFGDYSYDKVRLKGYNDSNNKKAKKINDIKYLDEYINTYCSYGARVFLIKKVN